MMANIVKKYKRIRRAPNRRWSPNEEAALIRFLKQNRNFEKPTAQIYYRKFLEKSDIKVEWKVLRAKVRNMRVNYNKAKAYEGTGATVALKEGETGRDAILKICSFFDDFDELFNSDNNFGDSFDFASFACKSELSERDEDFVNSTVNSSPNHKSFFSDACDESSTATSAIDTSTTSQNAIHPERLMSMHNNRFNATTQLPMHDEEENVGQRHTLQQQQQYQQIHQQHRQQKQLHHQRHQQQRQQTNLASFGQNLQSFYNDDSMEDSNRMDVFTDMMKLRKERSEQEIALRRQEFVLREEKFLFEKEMQMRQLELREKEIASQERLKMFELQMQERIAMKELEMKERLGMKELERK